MSTTPVETHSAAERRVREQARDAATLMVFSLGLSVLVALCLLLLAHVGR